MDVSIEKVNEDNRGAMWSIKLPDNQELMLFYCKKGYLRGGHSHDVDEVVLMLSGEMKYHKMYPHLLAQREPAASVTALKPGMSEVNHAGTPHMGEFLEDTWLVEWKLDTEVGKWTTTDYEPFRKQVITRIEERIEANKA